MRAILIVPVLVGALAACDSPTAPSRMLDGSVRGERGLTQPLPAGVALSTSDLNPQPLPPGRHFSTTTAATCLASPVRSGSSLYEPPDPCLK